MPSNHLIFCHPLLRISVFPSIRVFSNELGLCIRWPKYWNFSFSISPSSEYSGLISFRIGLISLLSKGLSRVFSSISLKTSILWHSAFFLAPERLAKKARKGLWPTGQGLGGCPAPWSTSIIRPDSLLRSYSDHRIAVSAGLWGSFYPTTVTPLVTQRMSLEQPCVHVCCMLSCV